MVEHAALLATIVGLLCNWKQEKGSVSQDRFQDFITWLTHHNFSELRDRITGSEELQKDLAAMLQQDFQGLDSKLDIITSMISSVASRIDGFAAVTKTLNLDADAISTQALGILYTFAKSEQLEMMTVPLHGQTVFYLLPNSQQFSVNEERFLEDDLKTLLKAGFMSISRYDNRGNPVYVLTRNGLKWISEAVTP